MTTEEIEKFATDVADAYVNHWIRTSDKWEGKYGVFEQETFERMYGWLEPARILYYQRLISYSSCGSVYSYGMTLFKNILLELQTERRYLESWVTRETSRKFGI